MKVGGIWKDERVMFATEELERKEFHLPGQLDYSGRRYLMEDPCKCQVRKQYVLAAIGDLDRKMPLKSKVKFCSRNIFSIFCRGEMWQVRQNRNWML